MTDEKTKEEMTNEATAGMTPEEKDIFAHYIASGASIWIEPARWASLAESGKAYIEARRVSGSGCSAVASETKGAQA